jgi:deazaflavin-dependent oxidoreductase (nitroreductase family)
VLLKRTGGRLGGKFLGVDVVVLRTTGRKSGELRDAPLFYVRDGDALAVVASNGAAPALPAWYLNLQADPDAEVVIGGNAVAVRARAATPAEVERLWPRLAAAYSGYDHYKSIATRELPMVILEPEPAG